MMIDGHVISEETRKKIILKIYMQLLLAKKPLGLLEA